MENRADTGAGGVDGEPGRLKGRWTSPPGGLRRPPGRARPGRPLVAGGRRRRRTAGVTLIELLVTVAIVGLLAGMLLSSLVGLIGRVKYERAIADIRALERQISARSVEEGYPSSLDELEIPTPFDPWGHPYRYLRISDSSRGTWRKDRFLVPLNSDYDLYSMGPDGDSRPPLTAKPSRDDVVRAGNGAYVGRADEY